MDWFWLTWRILATCAAVVLVAHAYIPRFDGDGFPTRRGVFTLVCSLVLILVAVWR